MGSLTDGQIITDYMKEIIDRSCMMNNTTVEANLCQNKGHVHHFVLCVTIIFLCRATFENDVIALKAWHMAGANLTTQDYCGNNVLTVVSHSFISSLLLLA